MDSWMLLKHSVRRWWTQSQSSWLAQRTGIPFAHRPSLGWMLVLQGYRWEIHGTWWQETGDRTGLVTWWFTRNSPLFLVMDKFAYGFWRSTSFLVKAVAYLENSCNITHSSAFTPLPLFDTRADGDAAMRQGRENRQWFSRRWHGFLAAVCFFEPWTKEGHTDMRQSMAKPHEWSLWSIPHQRSLWYWMLQLGSFNGWC